MNHRCWVQMDVGLFTGDVVKVGKTVELLVLGTPGHDYITNNLEFTLAREAEEHMVRIEGTEHSSPEPKGLSLPLNRQRIAQMPRQLASR